MRVTTIDIPDVVVLIEPKVFRDPRGLFLETYHARRYRTPAFPDPSSRITTHSLCGAHYAGSTIKSRTLRGKVAMVTDGAVYDVVVDIRKGSPTFGRWYGVDLSSENRLQVYVPPGCAHGFCVTSDRASFIYKCTDYYAPGDERGIIWNDPALSIPWPVTTPILSVKDQAYKSLAETGSESAARYRPIGYDLRAGSANSV